MMPEEAGEEITNPLGRTNRIKQDVIDGWTSGAAPERIGDVNNLKFQSGAVGLQDEHNGVMHLPLDGLRPLLPGHTGNPGQPLNADPIFVVPVLDPVVKLCIGSNLGADLLVQADMAVLQVGHPIFMVSDLFLNLDELTVGIESVTPDQHFSLIKDMKHVVEAGNWRQMNPVGEQVLAGETGNQTKIRWSSGGEDR